MASPLARYANLSLLFQVPTGEPIENADGDVAIATVPLPVVAYVKQQSRSNTPRQDGELCQTNLSGFYLAPQIIPAEVEGESVAEAIEWDLEGGFILPADGWATLAEYETFITANTTRIRRRSEFVYAPNLLNQFGVDRLLGQKLEGFLIQRSDWVNKV
ncbi:hypothetical protein [Pseudanabaena sp. FACHB-2040]|uniref:hypothetical protein n=1 Tax=Pseudanabaena sp. FACHB-2040 TaxID=2692859 RepID=UPI0016864238|nr:hypothetical protein [Pseudanabaena sp. FACHB-2040]MBD2261368.1 hypothetical protein [Pseudanabaena sp. FACHB-2040]